MCSPKARDIASGDGSTSFVAKYVAKSHSKKAAGTSVAIHFVRQGFSRWDPHTRNVNHKHVQC